MNAENNDEKTEKKVKAAKARAESLTPEERSEIARMGAAARWSDMPSATHGDADHPLRIGSVEIPCYVLADGRRVLVQTAMIDAIGMSKGGAGGGGDRLVSFASGNRLKAFIAGELHERIVSPVKFRTPSGNMAYGYDANVLAELCEAVLNARDAGVLQKQQMHIVDQCSILRKGFVKVGIIALVDEATGYQYDRARTALAEILEAFINDELGKWARRFSDEFYKELFRLKDLKWPFEKNPPQYVGHWTNNIVYSRMAPGILDELRSKTPRSPKGHRKGKLHQWLTEDIGHPKLQEHLAAVTALMKSSDDWNDFERRLNKALPKYKKMPLFDKLADENGELPVLG